MLFDQTFTIARIQIVTHEEGQITRVLAALRLSLIPCDDLQNSQPGGGRKRNIKYRVGLESHRLRISVSILKSQHIHPYAMVRRPANFFIGKYQRTERHDIDRQITLV